MLWVFSTSNSGQQVEISWRTVRRYKHAKRWHVTYVIFHDGAICMRGKACLSGDNAPITVEPQTVPHDGLGSSERLPTRGLSLSAKYPTVVLGGELYNLRARAQS